VLNSSKSSLSKVNFLIMHFKRPLLNITGIKRVVLWLIRINRPKQMFMLFSNIHTKLIIPILIHRFPALLLHLHIRQLICKAIQILFPLLIHHRYLIIRCYSIPSRQPIITDSSTMCLGLLSSFITINFIQIVGAYRVG